MAIIAQKYSENFPKISRTCHVCLPGETYLSFPHVAGNVTVASSRDDAQLCTHDIQRGGEGEPGSLKDGPSEACTRQEEPSC